MASPRGIAILLLCLNAVARPVAAAAADWPREVRAGEATIVLYQPQFDSLEGIDTRARIAVAIQRPDTPPEFGALWVAATLDVDRDEDTAHFQTFVIERARFPDATEREVKDLIALIERVAPTWDLRLSLTELRAGLEPENGNQAPGFRNDPPRIIYRDRPAILVTLDGEPKLQAIPDTPYQRVMNTPFPIVFEPATGQYWLFGSAVWFTARDLVHGPWSPRNTAPEGIARLFRSTAGTGQPPLDPGEGVPADKLRRAEIVVTTTASELISTDGPPQYRPLVGDEMLYVTNTGSDLFLEVPTKQYYVVLSGRWYRSPSLAGPWTYVQPGQVPKAFADVPRKSEKAEVLAHVPGTEEAKDAIMDSMIPQTSAVRRGEAALEVTYDGTPRFDRIPGTALFYARNTAAQVLKVQDRYYAVDRGIWYVSDSPYGPWTVADARPDEVEDIPPSSPAYNLRYVYIYDYTPEIVYVGYLPGYTWAFPYQGAIVYGTGFYYRPWLSPAFYYPQPCTWGFHMRYNPWYGWGYGMSWSAGWLSFSYGWGGGWGDWLYGYRPGRYPGYRDGYWQGYNAGFWSGQHTIGWFGPGGYRPPPPHEPRRGIRPPDRSQIASLAGSAGGRPAARPWPVSNIYAQPVTRPGAGKDSRPPPPVESRPGIRRDIQPVPRPNDRLPNNVFVNREGIPYRLTKGGWQTRENRQWRPVPELQRPPGRDSQSSVPVARSPAKDPRRGDPRRTSPPAYQPSPPVELRREAPAPPARTRSRDYRPEPGAQPPPSGGWGNRSVPRDGPSVPAANESRMRSHGSERGSWRQSGGGGKGQAP